MRCLILLVVLGALFAPLPRDASAARAATTLVPAELPPDEKITRTTVAADLKNIYLSPLKLDPIKTSGIILGTAYLMRHDVEIYNHVDQKMRTPEINAFMDKITWLGDGAVDLGIAGVFYLAGEEETAYKAANAVVYAGLATRVLKIAVGMPRPETGAGQENEWFTLKETYDAMPSGHTATAFALAEVLARQYPRYKWYFYGTATVVGISRIYVNAHWASDVLAGAAIGVYSARHVNANSTLFSVKF
ncbi:MAG: phosphatase PAP2 family protein [Syntrophothermus sp.]